MTDARSHRGWLNRRGPIALAAFAFWLAGALATSVQADPSDVNNSGGNATPVPSSTVSPSPSASPVPSPTPTPVGPTAVAHTLRSKVYSSPANFPLKGELIGSDSLLALTYAWTQIAGPAGSIVGDPTVANPLFIVPQVTQLTIVTYRLTVTGNGPPSSDTVNITVLPVVPKNILNAALNTQAHSVLTGPAAKLLWTQGWLPGNQDPILPAWGDLETANASPIIVDLSGASDPDGDKNLAYSFDSPSNGTLSWDSKAMQLTYTPNPLYPGGTDAIGVSLSDNLGGYAVGTIKIVVGAPVSAQGFHSASANNPPVASDGSATTPFGTAVQVTLQATDPDGDPLTFSTSLVQSTDGQVAPTASPNIFTFTPSENFSGRTQFEFTVSDGKGGTDKGTFTVVVDKPGNKEDVYYGSAGSGTKVGSASGGGQQTTTFNSQSFPDGDHPFTMRSQSDDGQVADASSDYRIDNTAPTGQFIDPTPPDQSFDAKILHISANFIDNFPNNIRAVLLVDPKNGTTIPMQGGEQGAFVLVNGTVGGYDTTGLSDGSFVFGVHGLDLAGNVGIISRTFTVDNTAPAPSLSVASLVHGSAVPISFSATDAGSGVKSLDLYRDKGLLSHVDGASGSYSWNTLPEIDGSHLLELDTVDNVGNASKRNIAVTIDNTPPTLTLVTPSDGAPVTGKVSRLDTAVDANGIAKVEFYVDGTLAATVTSSPYSYIWDSASSKDGAVALKSIAYDNAGNTTEQTETVNVLNPDTTPPVVSITNPVDATTIHGTVAVKANASDDHGVTKVEIYIDGALKATLTSAPYSMAWNTLEAAKGSHALVAKAYDAANNVGTSATVTVTVDNSNVTNPGPPKISITAPVDGSKVRGTVAVNTVPEADVAIDHVDLYDGATLIGTDPAAPYNFSWNTAATVDGPHTLKAVVFDSFKQSAFAQISVTVNNVDTTPPTVSLASPANGSAVKGVVTLVASAADDVAVAKVEFYVDGSLLSTRSAAPYTASLDTTNFKNGSHTIKLVAYDAANNSASSTSTLYFDNTLPNISSVTPADGAVVSGTVIAQFTADDADSGDGLMEIDFDGTPVAGKNSAGASPMTLAYQLNTASVSDGQHQFKYTVTDRAGNVRTVTTTLTINNAGVSGPAPQFRIINALTGSYVRGLTDLKIALVSGTATGAFFKIDGNSFAGLTDGLPAGQFHFPWNTNGLPDGHHAVEYQMTNQFGLTSQSADIIVDNTFPTLVISSPSANEVVWGVRNVVLQVFDFGNPINHVTLKVGAITLFEFPGNSDPMNKTYAFAWNVERLDSIGARVFPDGQYTLTAQAFDMAGNMTIVTQPITIDTKNIPLSSAQFQEHPARLSLAVTNADSAVSVTFSNIAPDLTAVNDDALACYVLDENGVNQRVPGSVYYSGNALIMTPPTPIAPNSEVLCTMTFQEISGGTYKGLRETWNWVRGIQAAAGGVVRSNGIVLTFPRNSLPKDLFIRVSKLANSDVAGEADQRFSEQVQNTKTVVGPLEVYGMDADDVKGLPLTKFEGLSSDADFRYDQAAGDQPIGDPRVNVVQNLDENLKIWKPVGATVSSPVAASGAPLQTKTIEVPITRLGIFRVAALPVPLPGVNEFFNYPNPFSPDEGGTDFNYSLGDNSDVRIIIYDLLGNLVKELDYSSGAAGGRVTQNIVHWDGRNGAGKIVASGGYIVHAFATDSKGVRTMAKYKTGVVR